MKVLIVDDDPATVSFMRLAFIAAGDDVATASTVDDAIGVATAEPPDVVLSDLTFGRTGDPGVSGGTDGFLLVQALRDRPETAEVGILAISGASFPEVRRAAEDRGFDGFVAKPVDVASLIERVHRLGRIVADRRSGQEPEQPSATPSVPPGP